jgi:hypothetical protein
VRSTCPTLNPAPAEELVALNSGNISKEVAELGREAIGGIIGLEAPDCPSAPGSISAAATTASLADTATILLRATGAGLTSIVGLVGLFGQ